jgi:hypothetical protein
MTIWRKVRAPALAVIMVMSLTSSPAVAAPGRLPPPPHTALQTADRFAAIAYRYKGWWAGGHGRNMGKRDVRYASSALDKILRGVRISSGIAFPNELNWFPGTGLLKTRRSLPDGTIAMGIRLPIVETYQGSAPTKFHIYVHLHVKLIRGAWKVVGVRMVDVDGPDKYCMVGGPTGDLYCNIFPGGSN